MHWRRSWKALRPRRLPLGGALAYFVALAAGLALLWSVPPVAIRVLAPQRPVTSAPELQGHRYPWWLAVRLGDDFWIQVLRTAWPMLPDRAPRDEGSPGAAGSGRRLEPLVVWSASRALDVATVAVGGFRWSEPFTWLAVNLPALGLLRAMNAAGPVGLGANDVGSPQPIGDLVVTGPEPTVLVYHTHATESFATMVGKGADPFSPDRSRDMVRVGDELTRALVERGVQVAHSRALYDREGRVGAYERSLAGISPILARYPTIRLIIDMHRDSAPRRDTMTQVGGQSVAKILFVVGSGQLLPHPGWAVNAAFAARVAVAMELAYPGILRKPGGQPYLVEKGRYNQHVGPGAVLIEVGGVGNSLEEELATARLLAPVLDSLFRAGEVPVRTPDRP